jgi:hypothetical protein
MCTKVSMTMAIAWMRTRSPAIHPITGARLLDQLIDNLGSVEIDLAGEAIAQLEADTEVNLGLPTYFSTEVSPWVFGASSLTDDGN